MKISRSTKVFGPALLALSAYSYAAPPVVEVDATAGLAEPIVVTAGKPAGIDTRIRNEVQARINERPSLRFFNIAVYSSNQDVYLGGVVDTTVDSGLAEAVAKNVAGARNVYNGLGVGGGGG